MRRRTVAITAALAIVMALAWPSAAVAAAPTASIVVSDTALSIGETSVVTVIFSEAASGFSNEDILVANGTLSAVTSADGGVTWTATLTPAAGVTDPTNVITIDLTGVADSAGNPGFGTVQSNNYAIDTERPTAAITLSHGAVLAGETSTVTFTFSEAVSGFTTTDATVPNGTLTAATSMDGGITWTATFTPNADVRDATNVITVPLTGVFDLAGNFAAGPADSGNYSVSTVRPTASVTVFDNALTAGETTPVNFTFSEAVSGFTGDDVTVPNGTLSALSSTDGGVTWTATLTPTANIFDSSNVIVLDLARVRNVDGNAGTGTAASNNYRVHTQRPTATVVVSDTELTAGETALVTFAFSEVVTGFTSDDIAVANGALTAPSSADGGVTWTATFTPNADIAVSVNTIVLDLAGVANLTGNTGVGTVDSNPFAIRTAAQPAQPGQPAQLAASAGGTAASLPATGADIDQLLLLGLLLMGAGLTASITVRRSSAARPS